MNPFRCPCIKFQKGRSGCGERKRFHLREITRVCQTERETCCYIRLPTRSGVSHHPESVEPLSADTLSA